VLVFTFSCGSQSKSTTIIKSLEVSCETRAVGSIDGSVALGILLWIPQIKTKVGNRPNRSPRARPKDDRAPQVVEQVDRGLCPVGVPAGRQKSAPRTGGCEKSTVGACGSKPRM
jgi:hypothetical protein